MLINIFFEKLMSNIYAYKTLSLTCVDITYTEHFFKLSDLITKQITESTYKFCLLKY